MSAELVPVVPETSDLANLTLDQLAERARSENEALHQDLKRALGHAIRLGEFLSAAFAKTRTGTEWQAWCESIGLGVAIARRYARLATYQHLLPPEAYKPWVDQNGATRLPTPGHAYFTYLAGLPPLRSPYAFRSIDDGVKEEARRLRKAGASYGEIADLLGLSTASVYRVINPEAARRRSRRQQKRRKEALLAERALAEKRERDDRDRLALESSNPGLSKAYQQVRALCSTLHDAGAKDAYAAATRCEGLIVEALRAERTVA